MFKALAKLRRAPHHVRENFTALITIGIVGVITLVWFVFFLLWILSADFKKDFIPKTVPETAHVEIKAPFSN